MGEEIGEHFTKKIGSVIYAIKMKLPSGFTSRASWRLISEPAFCCLSPRVTGVSTPAVCNSTGECHMVDNNHSDHSKASMYLCPTLRYAQRGNRGVVGPVATEGHPVRDKTGLKSRSDLKCSQKILRKPGARRMCPDS